MIKGLLDYYKRQQFFPNLLSLFINPFFFFRLRLVQKIKFHAKELQGKLLDFGCRSKPYKILFDHIIEYVGVDIENEGHDHKTEEIDIYYNGKTLPFDDDTFDSIFSNEVLEHVPDLRGILLELHRVLKPGGKVLFTVPFVCFEHELPYDFRRLTNNGLENVLIETGFEICVVEKSGTFVEVLVQLWLSYLRELFYTKNKYFNILINILLISPFTILGFIFSYLLPSKRSLYFDSIIVGIKR